MKQTKIFTPEREIYRPFTPREWRAIKSYVEANNVVPQLSRYPNVRFHDRASDQLIGKNIKDLLADYDQERKARAQERARLKREAER